MLKFILSQVRTLLTINLKVIFRSQTQAVLQVCFWGQSLSFSGSSVWTGPSSVKCMDAALAQMGLQGMKVLNYLNDWLILMQSWELAICHRDLEPLAES